MAGHKSRAERIRERGACRVYWGSHGCEKPRGHTGIHFCSRGCVIPDETTVFFGEDVIPNDPRVAQSAPATDDTEAQPTTVTDHLSQS